MEKWLRNAADRLFGYSILGFVWLAIALGPGMVVIDAADWPVTLMHVVIGAAIWWGFFFGVLMILCLILGSGWLSG